MNIIEEKRFMESQQRKHRKLKWFSILYDSQKSIKCRKFTIFLLSWTMHCDCFVQNRSYFFTFILPFRNPTFRNSPHECLVHYFFLVADRNIGNLQRSVSVVLSAFLFSVFSMFDSIAGSVALDWCSFWFVTKCIISCPKAFFDIVVLGQFLVFSFFGNIKPSPSCGDSCIVHNG